MNLVPYTRILVSLTIIDDLRESMLYMLSCEKTINEDGDKYKHTLSLFSYI